MLNLKKNLISIGCLTKNEKVVAFSNKQCWIVNQRNKLTLAGHSDKKKKKLDYTRSTFSLHNQTSN